MFLFHKKRVKIPEVSTLWDSFEKLQYCIENEKAVAFWKFEHRYIDL